MIFKCLDKGMTPVSILGTLVKAMVAFDKKGTSGEVKSLKRILPDRAVNSALTSKGAFRAVWKRMAKPGGVDLALRFVTKEATG